MFATSQKGLLVTVMTLLPVSVLLALTLGSTSLAFNDVISALFSFASDTVNASRTELIVWQIRMPRTLLAMFVGALLAVCGATTQGLFRNPLADPSLIGVTAGASAGAAITIFLLGMNPEFNKLSSLATVSLGAFIGGIICVVLVYKLATGNEGTSVATMLLAGIAITAVAGGLTSLIEFFADNDDLRRISLWKMGGLDGANYQRVTAAGAICLLLLIWLPRFSRTLNALLLGESEARHLGIAVQRTKIQIIILVALAVATALALAGTITFVGLIVPHIIRLLIGPDHRYLLPISAVGGAVLLVLADTTARTLFAPIELPVGLVTAFIGAPFFISLLRQRHAFGMR